MPTYSFAITWDEPWRKEIIQKSDIFVYGKITESTDSLFKLEVSKSFSNNHIGTTITIDGFFLLNLCSISSGQKPEFRLDMGNEGYFLLKKNKNGNYDLPTPTSGFDLVNGDKVHATFRHSYHQAAVSINAYEMAYDAIWKKYHGGSYSTKELSKFIDKYLSLPPAGFGHDEIELFFNQHVALESAYHLDIKIDDKILIMHAESENFHSQVSSIRAMMHSKSKEIRKYLIKLLEREDRSNFSKVFAIWTQWNWNNKKVKAKLLKKQESLSDEVEGFGGNLMDNRICTNFPSPKDALVELKKMANKVYAP